VDVSNPRKGLILALCCAAQFMVVLDVAIVNVALPVIEVDLGLGQSALQWIVIAYGLLLGGFLLLGGRLGDFLGRRRVLLAGLAIFSGASLVAAALFSFIFLGSLLMQQVVGYSPTRAGVAWLATTVTAFVAAGLVGARLASAAGVKRLLVGGLSLLALGVAWLTRVPSGADYVADLLPAFILAGIAIGLTAPSVQIGALSGVKGAAAGLASGLVETMRQIGGAVGIAAVSTVLLARTRDAAELAGRNAGEAAALEGFQAAFMVVVALAASARWLPASRSPARSDWPG
jgi:predicted MFS family arabinose efflux permease